METILIAAGCTLMIGFVLYQAVRSTRGRATTTDYLQQPEFLTAVDNLGAPVTANGTMSETLGPSANTNGIPMLNGSLDVTGHTFGDTRID